jgi:hypothetical protein
VLPEEFRPLRQQKAARTAFGAADFQEQRIDLVLGLDGMRDPTVIVTEATLMATSTANPATRSRIWPIARQREASGMAKGIGKRD